MILEQVPAVQRLSPDEKWQLIDELWQELLPRSDSEPHPNGAQLREETLVEFRGLPLSLREAETRIWRRGRVRYW